MQVRLTTVVAKCMQNQAEENKFSLNPNLFQLCFKVSDKSQEIDRPWLSLQNPYSFMNFAIYLFYYATVQVRQRSI